MGAVISICCPKETNAGESDLNARLAPQPGNAREVEPVNVPPPVESMVEPVAEPVKLPDPITIFALEDFLKLDHACGEAVTAKSVVHLKGFNKKLCKAYHTEVLRRLSGCKLLVWDGFLLSESGYTSIVAQFLRENPDSRACAFRNVADIDSFTASWTAVGREFPGRIHVVALKTTAVPSIEASALLQKVEKKTRGLPQAAKDQLRLACIALRATKANKVFAIGGPGLHSIEAEASIADGVHWAIFAASRGQKEKVPSLLDWAAPMASQKPADVELVRGEDPNEADAFAVAEHVHEVVAEEEMASMIEDAASMAAGGGDGEISMPEQTGDFERMRQQSLALRQFTVDEAGEVVPVPVQEAPAPTKAPTHPDFGGVWTATGAPEGIESFMTLKGMGFLARKAAMAFLKSFTAKMTINSEDDGARFLIVNQTPKKLLTNEFTTNGVEFEGIFGAEESPGKGTAFWEGDKLVLNVQMPDMVMETTRFLEGDVLVELTKATKGATVAEMSRRWLRAPPEVHN